MKLSIRPVIIGAGLAIAALPMQAQETLEKVDNSNPASEMYLRVDAGPAILQDLTAEVDDYSFDTGARFDIGFGYNFTPSWAVEFEAGAIFNSVDTYGGLKLSDYAASGDFYQVPLLVNYIYTMPTKCPVQPFVGVGIGAVIGIMDQTRSYATFNSSDVTFGYQALAGLKYHLTEQVDLNLTYKFLGTTDHDWTSDHYYLDTDPSFSHSLLLGLSFNY